MAKEKNYESIHCVFAKNKDDEIKLYDAIREYCYKERVPASIFLKKTAIRTLKNKGYLK